MIKKASKSLRYSNIVYAIVIGLMAIAGCANDDYAMIVAGNRAFWICSGLFVSDMDEETIINQDLIAVANPDLTHRINYDDKTVTGIFESSEHTAVYRPGLGCTLVLGTDETELRGQIYQQVEPLPADPETVSWPTGDLNAIELNPEGVDMVALNQVVEEAFSEPNPASPRWTRAVVVVYKGKIIAERYAPEIDKVTPLIGWSMTKSLTSTLIGILVGQGKLSIDERSTFEEWEGRGDPRRDITLNHLLHMSSGLEFEENYTPR